MLKRERESEREREREREKERERLGKRIILVRSSLIMNPESRKIMLAYEPAKSPEGETLYE